MKCSPGYMTATSRAARRVALAALFLLSFLAFPHARAATFCITAGDVAGLQSALVTAVSNGEDDFIKLQRGQYSMGSNFLLDYESVAEHHDLTIDGGYINTFGGPCTPPFAPDARQTVLDGGLLRLHLAAGVGSLTLKSITVQNTFGIDPNHPPVEIIAAANSTGTITIENAMFIGNGSTNNPAVYVLAADGGVFVRNSVFAGNGSFVGQSPILLGSTRIDSSFGVIIVNSTFTANSSSAAAVRVYTPMCLALAANDIFWGNVGGDVLFDNPPSTFLANDDFGDLAEANNTQASALLSLDPLFNPDFSIDNASRLHEAGSKGGFLFVPGDFDAFGNPRVVGARPDVGAYETQDDIFADDFE